MKHALIPLNLDLTLLGDKADKIAYILDRVYRKKAYSNQYGFARKKRDLAKPVAINMEMLKKVLHENPAPIMDRICLSKRHKKKGTQPVEKILIRAKRYRKGVHSTLYKLARPFRVKPAIYRLQRTANPIFRYDKKAMEAKIATWPENYRKVCENIKILTLEMNEKECKELVKRIRDQYIEEARSRYFKDMFFTDLFRNFGPRRRNINFVILY